MHDDILDLLRSGDAAAALARAREAADASPDDPALQRLLAAALHADGDADAARAVLEAAVARFPDDADLHLAHAALLLGAGGIDAAREALARGTAADPNLFAAYVMQAQLALARGDVEEAARLAKLSARVDPDHPRQAMVDGLVALRRGHAADALGKLSRASAQAPDDAQVLHALGLAYIANDHLAFAEQAFRTLVERRPERPMLRGLLADLIHRQGRTAEAAALLAPLLSADNVPPGLRRFAGELALAGGDPAGALAHLRPALAEMPGDGRTLALATSAWRAGGLVDDARNTLDAALATSPASPALWRARMAFATPDDAGADTLLARWETALPDDIGALEAAMQLQAWRGDADAALRVATRIVARAPGHLPALWRVFVAEVDRDPAAAAARVRAQLESTTVAAERDRLQCWLGLALDQAGDAAGAIATWSAADAGAASRRLAVPPRSGVALQAAGAQAASTDDASTQGASPASAPRPPALFLFGPPGSQVERLATLFEATLPSFRGDRFGPVPPPDALQDFATPARLARGELSPRQVADDWRGRLAWRGIVDDAIVDWLPWWDDAYAAVLQAGIAEGELVVVLRDPRDMLLAWQAAPSPVPFRFDAPGAAADRLAALLDDIAALHESQPFPVRLLHLDAAGEDRGAFAMQLAQATGTVPALLPDGVFLPPPLLPAGRWRAYAATWAQPFARLQDVAVRLGYPRE